MFYVIAENRKSVHSSSTHLIFESNGSISHEDFIKHIEANNYFYIEKFDTMETATEAMDTFTLNNTKKYTKMLNQEGLPAMKDLDEVFSRWVLVYIDVSLTTILGVYSMPIHNFCVLKKHFTTIRLANDAEIEACVDQKANIPVSDEIFNTINILGLQMKVPQTVFVNTNNPQDLEAVDTMQKDAEQAILGAVSDRDDEESNNSIVKLLEMMGDPEPLAHVDAMKTGIKALLEDVKTKRDTMSVPDLFKYVMSQFGLDSNNGNIITTDIDIPD